MDIVNLKKRDKKGATKTVGKEKYRAEIYSTMRREKKPAGNEWIGGGGKEGEGWREMEIEEM